MLEAETEGPMVTRCTDCNRWFETDRHDLLCPECEDRERVAAQILWGQRWAEATRRRELLETDPFGITHDADGNRRDF
jgi:hypothetical protein